MGSKSDDCIVEEKIEIEIEDDGKQISFSNSPSTVQLLQKVIAELIGTYFLIFAGCGSVVLDKMYGSVSFPGICFTWGLIVMVMIYAVGHISSAHLNPAVTISFTLLGRFPFKDAVFYIIAQLVGSLLASGTLSLLLRPDRRHFYGTVPVGSSFQSFVFEIIISFLLMFVISAIATDTRAMRQFAGVVIGSTITLNVFIAEQVSGASMNPARSLGPSIVMNNYRGIWIYIFGPTIGAVLGAFAYNLIRFTDKPLTELTKKKSFRNCF